MSDRLGEHHGKNIKRRGKKQRTKHKSHREPGWVVPGSPMTNIVLLVHFKKL